MSIEKLKTGNSIIPISYNTEQHKNLTYFYPQKKHKFWEHISSLATKYLHNNQYPNIINQKKGRYVFTKKIKGQNYYFKKYNTLTNLKARDLFNPLSLCFSTKAVKNFKMMLMLPQINIQTGKPILAINYNSRLFPTKSILVTPEIKGENAENVLNKHFNSRRKIIKRIYNIARKLYKYNIFHGDFYPKNLIYNKEENKLYVIDLDRMVISCNLKKILLKDFAKLNRHIFKNIVSQNLDVPIQKKNMNEFTSFLSCFFREEIDLSKKDLNYIFKKANKNILKTGNQEKDLLKLYQKLIDNLEIDF